MLLPAMRRLLVLAILILSASTLHAQVTALSCNAIDVQSAINSATAGQTVTIPSGSCTWTGTSAVVLAKAITLNGAGTIATQGAGAGAPVITLSSASAVFHVTKQTTGPTFIQNIVFAVANNKFTPHATLADGPWPNGQPIVFNHVTLQLNAGDFMSIGTPGGVIFANGIVHGTIVGDTLTAMFATGVNVSWTTADSLGARDTTGWMNIYIETNLGDGGANFTDCSDNCRMVVRNNIGHDGATVNSHGADTSPAGMRQFEIYNNNLTLPDKSCPGGAGTSPSNINQWIWIRGGSGVIYNNAMEPLVTACWGTKPNVKLADRGAEDARLGLTCAQTTYPTLHQIGQNNNGTGDFTDPIWFWGNTTLDATRKPNGVFFDIFDGWMFGNPCLFNWNTFFQWGRDGQNTSLTLPIVNPPNGGDQEGQGGTPKPGYTAFTYPHPLVSGQAVVPPSAPTTLTSSVSGSTVSLSWTASAGTPVPNGYTLYRGTVHNGPYAVVKSGLTTTSTTDTPANGAYFYVVTAFVGGIISGITGNGTTATVACTATCSFPLNTTVIIAGDSQAAFNGTFISTGQVTSNTFTFASTTSASGTGGGVWKSGAESARSNEVQATVPAALTVSFAPTSLTFASRTVGTSSPSQIVTVTNTSSSGSTVTFASVTFGGVNPGDFARSTTCTTLTTPGQQCTATVIFTPSAAGTRSALLTFVDNATGSPQTILVSGTGVSTTPGISLNPTSLDFGQQTLSTTSTARSIIVTNTGSGTLTISSVVASGDFAATTVPVTNCGGSLASLATCSVNVTFTPTATGGRIGSLTITDNAAGSPHVAGLTGTGITTKCAMSGNVTLSGIANVCQ
jgi:Abnormal spindle-like microcephaly-assoc'd, ASPM-SPD-2-Hydin